MKCESANRQIGTFNKSECTFCVNQSIVCMSKSKNSSNMLIVPILGFLYPLGNLQSQAQGQWERQKDEILHLTLESQGKRKQQQQTK